MVDVPELPVGEDIDEQGFLKAIIKGVAIGIPATFVVVMAIIYPSSGWEGFGAALWAAIVAGGFLGTVITLNLALGRAHAKARPPRHA